MAEISVPDGVWKWALECARGTGRTAEQYLVQAMRAARNAHLTGDASGAFHMLDRVKMSAQRNGGIANVRDIAQVSNMDVNHLEGGIAALVRLGFIEPVAPQGSFRLLD